MFYLSMNLWSSYLMQLVSTEGKKLSKTIKLANFNSVLFLGTGDFFLLFTESIS